MSEGWSLSNLQLELNFGHFDHFRQYFQINFNLFQGWTQSHMLFITYIIISTLSTNFMLIQRMSAELVTFKPPIRTQIWSF